MAGVLARTGRLAAWVAVAGLLSVTQARAAVPELAGTALYTTTVHGCRAVDLTTWHHRTRDVLRLAQVRVQGVQLCNGDRFPVFTAVLPYDVDGPNDRLLNRLYADLAEANGFWSFALVDPEAALVTTVTIDRSARTVTPAYETFRP